ncbi:MAG: LolA-like putative outer membrane lipoprotein chaperone [Prevotella sp.]|jgi:outer membrane lipoprotein-sorting protein
MRKLILFSFCFLISVASFAQNEKQARKVLDKASAIISNRSGAKANFAVYSNKVKTTGSIAIKGNKFQVTTPQAIVWYNGKTQWSYMKQNNEVNISNPNQSQRAQMNPYVFVNCYKKGYKMNMKDVGNSKEIHLTATSKNSIPQMYIIVDDRTGVPSHVKMKINGSWTTIVISNFKKANLSDSYFNFNAKEFPHAELIDLR